MTTRNEYDAFGVQTTNGSSANSIGYTGQRLDTETGLMALGNGERYYSPNYARFIQQDSYVGMPDMPQSLNRYAYSYNNPNKYTDPSGNIADDNRGSLANSAREYGLNKNGDNNWWNVTKNFAARTGYDLWDTISFGALSRQEEVVAKYENGEITAEQWTQMTISNAVVSGGQAALMFATGGAGTAFTAGAGILTRVAVGAGLGVAEKFLGDSLEMAGGFRENYGSATEYAIAAGTGGLFGAASGGRAINAVAKEGKASIGTELRALKGEVSELARNPRQALGREAGEFWKNAKAEARRFATDERGSVEISRNHKQLSRAKTAEELRNSKGTVTGGENLPEVNGQWLRGSDGNAGLIPKQVADKLRGKTFNRFDDFRESFWKAVSDIPELSNQFKASGRTLMKDGKSPFVVKSQRVKGQKQYQLHHKKPIHDYGDVYNLDNIIVVTPRYHQEVLDPGFHYNRNREER